MDIGYEVIFTITGMVLVFLILILLALIIQLEGKIFDRVSGKKQPAAPVQQPAAPAPARPAPAAVQKAAAPAPQVGEGVSGEVIAAIMAAIYAMGGGKYTIKAVRRGRNNWGKAGINDTTAPF